MTPPAHSGLAGRSRSLVRALAHVFGAGGTGEGIDFACAGGIIGLASGVLGFVGGILAIASGMLGVIGGVLGVVTSGMLGVVAGGVLGVVLGGAAGTIGAGIFLRDWNFRGPLSVPIRRAADRGAGPDASSLTAAASWRIMRVASGLMPRAAGRRWLAEAQSFLFEAPPGRRRLATRNYLLTAPQVITVSWTGALARRARLTGREPTAGQGDASGDPRS